MTPDLALLIVVAALVCIAVCAPVMAVLLYREVSRTLRGEQVWTRKDRAERRREM